jgi:hypothetical protein
MTNPAVIRSSKSHAAKAMPTTSASTNSYDVALAVHLLSTNR